MSRPKGCVALVGKGEPDRRAAYPSTRGWPFAGERRSGSLLPVTSRRVPVATALLRPAGRGVSATPTLLRAEVRLRARLEVLRLRTRLEVLWLGAGLEALRLGAGLEALRLRPRLELMRLRTRLKVLLRRP